MKAFFTIILFIFLAFNIQAEKIHSFKNFQMNNPLSYLSIRTLVEDQYGFLWFGSQEGLHRYDGYQFASFHHNINNPHSLSSDVISRILIDSQQQMWIATRGGGVNIYHENSQNFEHITTQTPLKLTDNDVNTLIEDSLGNIWIGTEKGVTIIFRDKQFTTSKNWQSKQIKHQNNNPKSINNNSVESILQVNNKIWLGTYGGGISEYDLQGKFIRHIHLETNNKAIQEKKYAKLIKVLYQDKQHNIWVGTSENGLFKISANQEKITHLTTSPQTNTHNNYLISNSIETIFQDSTGKIWIGTDKGLMIYQANTNTFEHITHSATNPQSLTNDFVLTVFEDSNHMIWIGTFAGVSRWDPHMTIFNQYSDKNFPQLSSSLVMSFEQLDQNNIIFATYAKGIYKLNLKNNKTTPFIPNILPKDIRIITLFKDDNILWVGTRFSGLFKVNLITKALSKYQYKNNNPTSISANSITDVIKDKHGVIWVSTFQKGLNKLNNDGSFTRFEQTSPLSNKGPSSNHILQLLLDNQGNIWLATYGGGINYFDPTTTNFKHIIHNSQQPNSLSNDIAWIMLEDTHNNLWVGTQTAGINILTAEQLAKQNFSFQQLSIKDGMKDQTVYGFAEDKAGNIWFSTNRGISRYSPTKHTFKHIDNRHGLIGLEYNHGAVFKASNGHIYFGNAKGFTSVDPNNIINDQPAPKVRLTNIYKLNEVMHFKENINTLKTITFDHNDQLISFEYVGLNYADPNSTRYKYRLLGFDKQWVNAGKLRRATYTNLPAGKYQLEIIAGNNDNIWSKPNSPLTIIVKPAPWLTWWAYLLYILLIALTLLVYSRFLHRKLILEQQQKLYLKQQVEEKTQEFIAKNKELAKANQELENASITDNITGVKSRRYLDIYIEQASQLLSQIHKNIQPIQRSVLPRLYILMIKLDSKQPISDTQLMDASEILLYSRNNDDIVIRWSDTTFAIIGYEKDDNARELAQRLSLRFQENFTDVLSTKIVFSFYPFNREQPVELSWDNISVMLEHGLSIIDNSKHHWLGLYEPKSLPFNYLNFLQVTTLNEAIELIKSKYD